METRTAHDPLSVFCQQHSAGVGVLLPGKKTRFLLHAAGKPFRAEGQIVRLAAHLRKIAQQLRRIGGHCFHNSNTHGCSPLFHRSCLIFAIVAETGSDCKKLPLHDAFFALGGCYFYLFGV